VHIKTIIAGTIAGICLAAPGFAADGHDAMKAHEVSNLSGTVTGSVLDGVVSGKLDLGNTTDSAADPYTAEARRQEALQAQKARNERIERQGKIKRDLARAEAKSKAKHKADKASRSKRSDRQKSASRERKRNK
jgi:hypothetical protein